MTDGHPARLIFCGLRKLIETAKGLDSEFDLTYLRYVVAHREDIERLLREEATPVQFEGD